MMDADSRKLWFEEDRFYMVCVARDNPRDSNAYRVPRRFGMGAILIGMTLFSVMVAMFTAAGVPGLVIAGVVTFCVAIGLSQMFLFGGRRPRPVSILVGVVLCVVLAECVAIYQINMFAQWNWYVIGELVQLTIYAALWGAFFGYLAGGALAGVFLFLDYIESWLTGKARSMPGK